MTYKMIQMVLRGATLTLTVIGFFYISECKHLARINNFTILGIWASYSVITMGLLIEAGLQLRSDKMMEASLLTGGISLALLSGILSFKNLWTSPEYRETDTHDVNNAVVSTLAIFTFSLDLSVLHFT